MLIKNNTSVSLYSIKNLDIPLRIPLRSATIIMPRTSSSPRYRIGSQVTDGARMQLLHFLRFAAKAAASCLAPTEGLRYFARYSHSSPCSAAIERTRFRVYTALRPE